MINEIFERLGIGFKFLSLEIKFSLNVQTSELFFQPWPFQYTVQIYDVLIQI